MIKNNLAVTKNPLLSQHAGLNFVANASGQDAICGIYFSTIASSVIDHEQIRSLCNLVQQHFGHPPDCYLLLELSHKGRVDARLFADADLTESITLNMQEDGIAVAANE